MFPRSAQPRSSLIGDIILVVIQDWTFMFHSGHGKQPLRFQLIVYKASEVDGYNFRVMVCP